MLALRASVRAAARPLVTRTLQRPAALPILRIARYSAAAGLDHGQIEARVLDVLKSFEKVDPSKVGAFLALATPAEAVATI